MATTTDEHARSIRLGSVAGTPVYLKRSWFLIAAVVTFLAGPTVQREAPGIGTSSAYLVALGFALLLLGSVFLHEVAHAVVARAAGVPPTDIVLDLWGGHTAFEREMPSPWRSVAVAAAGPATNGLIALVAGLGWAGAERGSVTWVVLALLTTSNGLVAALNALPGLPLDGGRVLEGLVWALTGSRTRGTVVAGRAGQVVAVAVVGWFVVRPVLQGYGTSVLSLVWSGAIAWMLWQGATGAVRYARFRQAAQSVVVGRLMRPAVAVSGVASVSDVRAVLHPYLPRAGASGPVPPPPLVVVLDGYGRPAGVVDETALAAVPPERSGLVTVGSVARGLPAVTLPAGMAGEELVGALQASPAAQYAVMDGGRVVGVLDTGAVAEALARG